MRLLRHRRAPRRGTERVSRNARRHGQADLFTRPAAISEDGRQRAQLLIDGSPTNFALHDISEGGAKGDAALDLSPGAGVYVRFEGGILVPAMVKWAEDGLVGLAFVTPVMLDRSGQGN
jgi:hypothetical protein